MRVKDKLQFRFEHVFISATVATLDSVNRLRFGWSNAYNPSLATDAICTDKSDVRVVPELDSENPLARKKGVVQLAAPLGFVR